MLRDTCSRLDESWRDARPVETASKPKSDKRSSKATATPSEAPWGTVDEKVTEAFFLRKQLQKILLGHHQLALKNAIGESSRQSEGGLVRS